ncbi:hypothetical protein Clacol_005897 [Clathrus columnatus]|uniref:DUF453-domain-containing protein n=1 Tax=Clathrus columnatus TaxID=1419009 RepID=A0AAV5AGP6_9AGAM|nr:hypothetical protein Clacol_005897 [Clathrus columnatus]
MKSTTALNSLPASYIRGGTSKGIFLNRKYLPTDHSEWPSIFLKIMGSPDPEHGRQMNGMGGGVSSGSKIMVLESPTPTQAAAGIDAQYTFAQIGIEDSEIDYSGNCGNLSSVVGIFAVDEGICVPRQSVSSTGETLGTVRLWNTNTNKEIHTTFPLTSDLRADLDKGQVSIAGVPGEASQIVLDFVRPGGARTGKLLPTNNPVDQLTITENNISRQYSASLVDATNPTVFVDSEEIFGSKYLPSEDVYANSGSKVLHNTIENIRKAGAVRMGLDPSAQAQPKIAILGVPQKNSSVPSDGIPHEIEIQALSMGVLHRAVPVTVGLCLGVAGSVEGTIIHKILQQTRSATTNQSDPERLRQGLIRMKHPSGIMDVGAQFDEEGSAISAKVIRTGRRLMQGVVWL